MENKESRKDSKYERSESHNIIPQALEMLEQTEDLEEALLTIFRRVGEMFGIDAIVLFKSCADNEKSIMCYWSDESVSGCVTRTINQYRDLSLDHYMKWYDETGMAVVDSCVTKRTKEENGFQTLLAVQSRYDYNTISHLVFVDYGNRIEWTQEEKILIKGLSTIFYSYLSKSDIITSQKETEYMLNYDRISGLPNFDKYKKDVVEIILEKSQLKFVVCVISFTNFQYINEMYGREIGNDILHQFGVFCKETLQSCEYCARGTGSNFVILMNYEKEENISKEVLEMCRGFTNKMDHEYQIGNLILIGGICSILEHTKASIIDTYKNAELARKSIRHIGYTEVCLYHIGLKEYDLLKNKVITNMGHALENNEFHVFLQPKVDLQTQQIAGAEALVRWIHEDGSVLYPDEFIPIFEENGLIKKIDYFVLEKTLEYLKMQIEQGVDLVPISVNFSRKHHEDPDFVDNIMNLLKKYGVDKEWIEIEITESTFTADKNLLSKNLDLLENKGLSVSIDDFGSGYSALNILSSIKANVIKIDKVFLQGDTGKDVNILKYLVQMIKSLNYQVIVEGVETKEQVRFLAGLECDMAQGSGYS
ncbi:MAG: bifunctional diguanylate cyclase/phosphodiesterase, partial [Eubacteriales bacterium]